MPRISCLMANYNTNSDYLKIAVESILNQSFKDFELIIVDDCSTDNSYDELEKFARKDDRIKLIRNESNQGLPLSLNEALKVACGEFIARMDTDDFSFPERFERQLKYLCENSLDLIGAGTNRMDENGNIFIEHCNESYSENVISELLGVVTCVPHPTWFGKKCVFDKLNGYRNIHSCEDYDFLLRATANGFKIGIADSVLLNYRYNLQSISRKNALKQLLTSDYLADNRKRIQDVTVDEIEKYLKKRLSAKTEKNYASAVRNYELFNAEMRKNKFKAGRHLFAAVAKSKYIIKNIKRSALVYKIKKRARKNSNA